MSRHVLDQLSAYMDGEVQAMERAAVKAHLGECAECSRRLEEMAAVDGAARSLEADVPPGYFDALPGHVRSRLASSERRGRRRPLAWAWAAAAAVALAVLTPSTLRRDAPAVAPFTSPPSAPEPTKELPRATDVPPASRVTDKAVPVHKAPKTDPLGRSEPLSKQEAATAAAPAATLEAALDEPLPPGKSALGGSEDSKAAAMEEVAAAPERRARQGFAPAPAAAAPQGAGRKAEGGEATAAGATLAERSEAKKEKDARASKQRPSSYSTAETAYRGLLPLAAASVEQARALREAWRALLRDDPAGPWADEAGVRVVEVGAEAYRLGGDPRDLSQLREDARSYLKRKDATQAQRVRVLLKEFEER